MSPSFPYRAVNVVSQWDDNELQPTDRNDVLPWELGLEQLNTGGLYWLIIERDRGHSHVRPVFAVLYDGLLYTTSSASAQKTRLLEQKPRCTLTTSTDGMDLIYQGRAVKVIDHRRVEEVASVYHRKYEWPVQPTDDGAFTAPYGAPSAGPPPYLLFSIEPETVYGLGTDERYAMRSTRWDFER